jgi:hypothetical protein
MTNGEYEVKIQELSSRLQDLEETISDLEKQVKRAISVLDYLPELNELESEEEV